MKPWIDGPKDDFTLAVALDESIELWRAMAISGCRHKFHMTERLFAKGRLCSKYDHSHFCPLCAYSYRFAARRSTGKTHERCKHCPWPGRKYPQCLCKSSPFFVWSERARTRKERQMAASAVLRLLKKLRKELPDELR